MWRGTKIKDKKRNDRERTRRVIETTEQSERRLSKKGGDYNVQRANTVARVERKEAEPKKGLLEKGTMSTGDSRPT